MGGFPPASSSPCCSMSLASRFAKWFAFRFLVKPGKSSPRSITLAISTMMVFPMVLFMSLYMAPSRRFSTGWWLPFRACGLQNIPFNFVAALPWNLLLPGLCRAGLSVARSRWARYSRNPLQRSNASFVDSLHHSYNEVRRFSQQRERWLTAAQCIRLQRLDFAGLILRRTIICLSGAPAIKYARRSTDSGSHLLDGLSRTLWGAAAGMRPYR